MYQRQQQTDTIYISYMLYKKQRIKRKFTLKMEIKNGWQNIALVQHHHRTTIQIYIKFLQQ